MMKAILSLLLILLLFPVASSAQDCKTRFSVAYTDGKNIQTGMTDEQSKFWQQNGEKKYKGICFDVEGPQYLILWAEELTNGQVSQGITDDVNRMRRAPTSTGIRSQGTERNTIDAISSSSIHNSAYFFVFDLSKEPAAMMHRGVGEADRPLTASKSSKTSSGNTPVQGSATVSNSDFSRTIADPVAALKNALDWLKKK